MVKAWFPLPGRTWAATEPCAPRTGDPAMELVERVEEAAEQPKAHYQRGSTRQERAVMRPPVLPVACSSGVRSVVGRCRDGVRMERNMAFESDHGCSPDRF